MDDASIKHDLYGTDVKTVVDLNNMGWRMYRGEKVIVRGGVQNVYECLSMLMEIYTLGYSNGVKDKGTGLGMISKDKSMSDKA